MRDIRVVGGGRVRIGPWKGGSTTAQMSVYQGHGVTATTIDRAVDRLLDEGYERVITAAVAHRDVPLFLTAGFAVARRLHLLSRDLTAPLTPLTKPDGPAIQIRSARRWERSQILQLDQTAFDDFWAFDTHSLRDAQTATPIHRLRVTSDITGYSLSGVAAGVGYLQRLGVHPSLAGQGMGGLLVIDALTWMRRRRAKRAFVNTQVDNERAYNLYLRHGFINHDEGLVILERSLLR